jgi:carbamoylphosphate synthase large subunit
MRVVVIQHLGDLSKHQPFSYPVTVTPAFTVDGFGRSVATDFEQLVAAVKNGLDASPASEVRLVSEG